MPTSSRRLGAMRLLRGGLLLIPLVLGIVLLAQTRADAVALRITGPGPTVVVCDEDAAVNPFGCSFPSPGFVSFSGSVGGFVTVSATASFPSLGSSIAPELDVVSLVSGTATGTIKIEGTQTGYSGTGTQGFDFAVGGTNTAPAGSSVTFKAYLDLANTKFGTATTLGTLGPFGPGPFSSGLVVSGMVDAAYSLTLDAVLVFSGASGSISFDENLRARVPEAAAIPLFGLGLLSLALARTRRVWALV